MMNLPLLEWASKELHEPRFSHIARRHANTAKSAFVREDGSVCHIVVFDPESGKRLFSLGGQGYAHGSSWTRGQAWALYGFTLSYLHTKEESYLETAEKVARHFLAHIPESGLIELWKATGNEAYLNGAERLLQALIENRCCFSPERDELLENGTVVYHDAEHHIPLIYGDYFFTEAVLKLIGKQTFLW